MPSRIWLAIATFSVVLLAGLATLTNGTTKRPSCLRGSIAAVLTACPARP